MKCTVGFNRYDSQPPWSWRLPCPALPDLTDRDYAVLCTTLLTGASLHIRTVVRIGYPAGPRGEIQKRAFRSDRAHLKYIGVFQRALRPLFSFSWSSSGVLRRIRPL